MGSCQSLPYSHPNFDVTETSVDNPKSATDDNLGMAPSSIIVPDSDMHKHSTTSVDFTGANLASALPRLSSESNATQEIFTPECLEAITVGKQQSLQIIETHFQELPANSHKYTIEALETNPSLISAQIREGFEKSVKLLQNHLPSSHKNQYKNYIQQIFDHFNLKLCEDKNWYSVDNVKTKGLASNKSNKKTGIVIVDYTDVRLVWLNTREADTVCWDRINGLDLEKKTFQDNLDFLCSQLLKPSPADKNVVKKNQFAINTIKQALDFIRINSTTSNKVVEILLQKSDEFLFLEKSELFYELIKTVYQTLGLGTHVGKQEKTARLNSALSKLAQEVLLPVQLRNQLAFEIKPEDLNAFIQLKPSTNNKPETINSLRKLFLQLVVYKQVSPKDAGSNIPNINFSETAGRYEYELKKLPPHSIEAMRIGQIVGNCQQLSISYDSTDIGQFYAETATSDKNSGTFVLTKRKIGTSEKSETIIANTHCFLNSEGGLVFNRWVRKHDVSMHKMEELVVKLADKIVQESDVKYVISGVKSRYENPYDSEKKEKLSTFSKLKNQPGISPTILPMESTIETANKTFQRFSEITATNSDRQERWSSPSQTSFSPFSLLRSALMSSKESIIPDHFDTHEYAMLANSTT